MAGKSVQVKAERLKGVRVHAVEEKPGLALVELKTAKGSQFYAISDRDLRKLGDALLQRAAPRPQAN